MWEGAALASRNLIPAVEEEWGRICSREKGILKLKGGMRRKDFSAASHSQGEGVWLQDEIFPLHVGRAPPGPGGEVSLVTIPVP